MPFAGMSGPMGAASGIGSLGTAGIIGGAVLGASAIDSLMGYGFGQAAVSRSWDKYKDSLTRGPSYAVQGLRAAGLNPILAVNRGGGLAGQSFSRVGDTRPTSGVKNALTASLLKEQIGLLREQQATQRAVQFREGAQGESLSYDALLKKYSVPEVENKFEYYKSEIGKALQQLELGTSSARRIAVGYSGGKGSSFKAALAAGGLALYRWIQEPGNREWLMRTSKDIYGLVKDFVTDLNREHF